jgi:MacB-like periplasmic core domain
MRAFFNILAQVFASITANKLRSFLTMFGIAWGVASLLLLVGLGEGFRSGQRRGLAELGNNLIMLWGGNIPAVAGQHIGMHPYKLTLGDADAIRTQAAHVRNATSILNRADLKEVSEFSSSGGQVMGVEVNYPSIRKLPIAQGRFLNEDDELHRRQVIVLGEKTEKLLFVGHPSLNTFVTLNGYRFQVVGVASKFGRGNNDGDNQKVYIPLSTMLELFPITGENVPQEAITSIQYQPTTEDLNETAKAEVHKIIGARHGFDPEAPDAFEDGGADLYRNGCFSWGRGDRDAGAGSGGDYQHYAGDGVGENEGDWAEKGSGSNQPQYPLSVFSRGVDADGGEWVDWDCRGGGVDGAARWDGWEQRHGLRSAAAGAVVGGDGDGIFDFVRDHCGNLPGAAGSDVAAG